MGSSLNLHTPEIFGAQDPEIRCCDWPGCRDEGQHRAPKSRKEIETYHWFCLGHVRQYNKGWNYYAGMSDAEVEADELTADGLTRTDLQDMLACVFEDDFAKLTALASIDWAAAAADRAAAKTDIEIHLVTADGTVLEGESVMNRPPPPAVPPPPLDDTHLHL